MENDKNNIRLSLDEMSNKLNELSKEIRSIRNCSAIKDNWIDSDDVCDSLNITKRTLQRYVKAGLFKSSVIGRRVYFKTPDILNYLEENHKYHDEYARSNK